MNSQAFDIIAAVDTSLEPEEIGFVLDHPLILTQFALGITDLYGLRCLRRGLTKQVNRCQLRAYRRRYYALENARRRTCGTRTRPRHCSRTLTLHREHCRDGKSPRPTLGDGPGPVRIIPQ